MAKEDIFDKEWVDERDKNNLEGLLEQLNLPPAVVKFVKENKRLVQAIAAAVIVIVVAWALYGTYRDHRLEKSSEALSAALELEGQTRLDKLAEVEDEFSGTSSALWAQINGAQELLKISKMAEANGKFKAVQQEIGKSSLLQPLVSLGIAQSAEALKNYEEAAAEYRKLVDVEGYQDIGYLGTARVHEQQGNKDKALEIYENYLTTIEPAAALQRAMIEEKIAGIKASM